MNYFGIVPVECVNGTGFGSTLFVAGCEHHCRECFNKKTWNRYGGEPFTRKTMEHLKACLDHPSITRLTISGGDPLSVYNRMEVLHICEEIRRYKNVTIWIYTGYTAEDLQKESPSFLAELALYATYLVDGKYEPNETHTKPFRGSDNQKIIRLSDMQEVVL